MVRFDFGPPNTCFVPDASFTRPGPQTPPLPPCLALPQICSRPRTRKQLNGGGSWISPNLHGLEADVEPKERTPGSPPLLCVPRASGDTNMEVKTTRFVERSKRLKGLYHGPVLECHSSSGKGRLEASFSSVLPFLLSCFIFRGQAASSVLTLTSGIVGLNQHVAVGSGCSGRLWLGIQSKRPISLNH